VQSVVDRSTSIPTLSPFVWSVQRDMRTVRLSGAVPGESARRALVDLARSAFPDASVHDDLRLARGALSESQWLAASGFVIRQLAQLPRGAASLSDLSLTFEGATTSADAYRAVMQSLSQEVPDGVTVTVVRVSGPPVIPYPWVAQRDNGSLVLSGFTPSPVLRADLVAAARRAMPGVSVVDRMQYGDGAPPIFAAAARLALDRLGELTDGRAALQDNVLALDGRTADAAAYDRVMRGLGQRPDGLMLGRIAIAGPLVRPYQLIIERTGDGALRVAGTVPSDDMRRALVNGAGAGAAVEAGDLRIAPGVPAGMDWQVAGAFALEQARNLRTGSVRIVDQSFSIEGEAVDSAAGAAMMAAARQGLPGGLRLNVANVRSARAGETASIAPVPVVPALLSAEQCQTRLAEEMARNPIEFERNQSDILAASKPLLERLVATLRRCPETQVEVAGHTDSRGAAATNARLSRERAAAVADWLVQAGIPERRLKAVGFGDSRPIASNDTDEGRQRNRRIEFTVR
jgi:OOP family OmpA-OmpF porin